MSDVVNINDAAINLSENTPQIYEEWMFKKRGPTVAQAMEIASSAFLGGHGTNHLGNIWRGFKIATDNQGGRHILKLIDGCVVSNVSQTWLESSIHRILHNAVDKGAHSCFMFSSKSISAIVQQIINLAKPIPLDDIQNVTFLNSNKLTWRKLDFNPKDGETPTFDYILSRVDSKKSVEALMCFIGAAFDPDYIPQNYVWMYGQGGDGKGTLLQVLTEIFGNAVGPVDNFLDKYWTSGLIGKRIAINPDVACPKIVLNGVFKAVTGGGYTQIRPMRESPFYGRVNTLLFLAANEPPRVRLNTADRRRLILVKFSEEKPKHIPNFEAKIKKETPGFILDCITAWGIHQVDHGKKIELDLKELDDLAEENSDEYQPLFDLSFYKNENSYVNPLEFRKRIENFDDRMKKWAEFRDFKKWGQSKGLFEYKTVRISVQKTIKAYVGIGLR